MRAVKSALDPRNLFNPGRLLPEPAGAAHGGSEPGLHDGSPDAVRDGTRVGSAAGLPPRDGTPACGHRGAGTGSPSPQG